ncbi:hypothetical protein QQF64_017316 [Cirrhinus molitorella]|uniref:ribonuclease H n=1 Tax=Cirrhinus molitorella TaxID=172907 RepID=A0ABR3LIF8_9TELE
MVPKPDGTLHFCNDFWQLNKVSEFDGYPMPQVDELLDRGHWQYRTLPFGLHGAPANFQRLMDILLRPHQAYAGTYLDDIVIHSEAWEDHLDRLWKVLSELQKAGLTANPRKCHLALSEAKYLGLQIGRGFIHPQEKKVEAILSAPMPRTKTQVRAFLGLAGYYRCFIPNFSSLATPLTDLTRKGKPEKIVWTPAVEEAFQRVKGALTSEPVFWAPDFSCPFLLQTDASDTGMGTCRLVTSPGGLSEARYLGFRIGQGLIMPQEQKMEAICSYIRPTTKSQIQVRIDRSALLFQHWRATDLLCTLEHFISPGAQYFPPYEIILCSPSGDVCAANQFWSVSSFILPQ